MPVTEMKAGKAFISFIFLPDGDSAYFAENMPANLLFKSFRKKKNLHINHFKSPTSLFKVT